MGEGTAAGEVPGAVDRSDPGAGVSFRVGVDIGGTFTDAIVVDPGGVLTAAKVSTTPDDFSRGFFGAIDFVYAAGHSGITDIGLVSGIKEDDGTVFESKVDPLSELVARGRGAGRIVRETQIDEIYCDIR